MQEMPSMSSGMGIKDYIVVILDRKWIVLLVFLLVAAAAVYYAETTPPVYQGMSVLMSESNVMTASVFPMMDPFFYRGPLEYLMNLQRLMATEDFTSSVVQRMQDELDIDIDAMEVRGSSRLLNPKDTEIIEVSSMAGEPHKAAALANIVAEVLIEKTSEIKSSDTNRALDFLKEQMNLVDQNLREAEGRLSNFREEEGIVGDASSGTVDRSTFGTGGTERYKRSSLVGQLSDIQAQLSHIQNEKDLIQANLNSIDTTLAEKKGQLAPNEDVDYLVESLTPQTEQLQNRIADWQLQLASLQETYTDKHYKVVELKQKIQDAQGRLQSDLNSLIGDQSGSVDPITEFQGLKVQKAQLTLQLRNFEEREKIAVSKIEQFKKDNPDLLDKEVELVRLERETRIREKTYMLLTDRYEEMLLLKQVNAQEFRIVDRAFPPIFPIKPNKVRIITLGIVLGLMLGLAVAFFLEYLDDSVRRMDDVEKLLGLPIVGSIPKIQAADISAIIPQPGNNVESLPEATATGLKQISKTYLRRLGSLQGKLVKNVGSKSPVAESYRSLLTNIQFADLDNPVKTILVTSPSPKEGKSLTTSNLALTMAQNGMRVLLIDADLRRPTVHKLFGCQRSPGLSELITSDLSNIEEYVQNTYADNLYVLPGGAVPPNPAGILGSDKMKRLIEEAKKRFDIVLFDSPPVVAMSDASVLAVGLDVTILVLHAGHTKRQIAAQAKDLMERLNINIFGVVLNGVDYSKRYGYYYYYYHYHDYYNKGDRDEI